MGDYIRAQSQGVHVIDLKDENKLRHFARLVECAERKWSRILVQGVFKIRAPREWIANQMNFRDVNHHFIMQYETWQPCVNPEETGCFARVTEEGHQVTKERFRALATEAARQPDPGESGRMTISRFFPRRQRHLDERKVTGTVAGSRFSDVSDKLDLRNLKTVLNLGTSQNGQLREEPGITVPQIVYGTGFLCIRALFLFFIIGSYGSTIPLQTGYMGLYTVSYNHGGKPRVWYVVHGSTANMARFEQALRQTFRHDFVERGLNQCRNPLQHNLWIVAPSYLRRHNIKYTVVVQQAGDIVVILARAYFMGFDCGFNMVETVQFATQRWIGIGKSLRPRMCDCDPIWLNPDDFDAA
ncbi:CRE-JMJD-2 protein [Aphelenchoides avenae]|nr:CRE-JMJD-2 protein [Aphelenchus avenae]